MDKKYTLVLVGIFLVSLIFYKNVNKNPIGLQTPETLEEIVEQRPVLAKRMDNVGPDKLYEVLKVEYAKNYHRHSLAHIFGELLYEKEGYKGIVVCDSAFSYGCYHAFFAKALVDKGMNVIFDLDRACAEKFGPADSGCQHGIGHGILQYIGYERLEESLALCDTLPPRGTSCLAGVFMEYNFPTDIDGFTATERVRKIDEKNPYKPCYSVDEVYREACFYELTRWWERLYSSDFEEIASLCSSIPEDKYKDSCFRGAGAIAVLATDHNLEKTILTCSKMPGKKERELCLIEASWAFYSVPDYRHLAPEVCASLASGVKERCVQNEAI